MYSSPVNSFTLAEHKIAVILLAAGRGSRMGGAIPKLFLPMPDGQPLLLHALKNAISLNPLELIVVIRPDLLPIIQAPDSPFNIPGLTNAYVLNPSRLANMQAARNAFSTQQAVVTYVPNPRFEDGMGTSLGMGATTLTSISPDTEGCLVLLGDEPAVPAAIVQRMTAAYVRDQAAIAIPLYGDQPGPPTIFSRDLFPDLARLEGDTGGRQLLSLYSDRVVRVPFTEQERPKDVDTPEDYKALG